MLNIMMRLMEGVPMSWLLMISGLGCHVMCLFWLLMNVIVRGRVIATGMNLSKAGWEIDTQPLGDVGSGVMYGSCIITISAVFIVLSSSESMVFWFLLQLCCKICIL